MQEIVKSIKAFLYDRTASPLFGAFVMAWLAWNYRVVIAVMDGDATLAEKLSFLDAYFADDHQFQLAGYIFHVVGGGHLVHGILMPALLTWVYIYIYPMLARPVYLTSLENLRTLRMIKNEQENLRLLTLEESRKLQKEIEQLRFKADEEVASYRTRITSLTETINGLEEAANKNKSTIGDVGIERLPEDVSLPNQKLEPELEPPEELVFKIESAIFDIYMSANSNSLQPEIHELVKKLAKYFYSQSITYEMFLIVSVLVFKGGKDWKQNIASKLQTKLNAIEIDHALTKLMEKSLVVYVGDGQIGLSSPRGNEMAVDSGLTLIDKTMRR